MEQPESIKFRPIKPEDYAFIYATWLRQLWFSRENLTTLAKETFFKLHHDRITKALKIKKSVIACLASDPDTIIGYAVDVSPTWSYVRKDWRNALTNIYLMEQLCVD